MVGSGTGRNLRGTFARGRVKKKATPPPGTLCAQMWPPWASTMALQMASPSPAPRSVSGAGAIEPLEDPRLLARGQAGSAIGHLHGDRLVGGRGDDGDGAVGRRVLDGVVEQVDQHLLDEHVVHGDQGQVGGNPRGHHALAQAPAEPAAGPRPPPPPAACHSFLRLECARLDPRHLEQVADQPAEPLGLLARRVQQLAARVARRGARRCRGRC